MSGRVTWARLSVRPPPMEEAWRTRWIRSAGPFPWWWSRIETPPSVPPVVEGATWAELQRAWHPQTARYASSLCRRGLLLLPSWPGADWSLGDGIEIPLLEENLRKQGFALRQGNLFGRPAGETNPVRFWDSDWNERDLKNIAEWAPRFLSEGFIGVLAPDRVEIARGCFSLGVLKGPAPWEGRPGLRRWVCRFEGGRDQREEAYRQTLEALCSFADDHLGRG